MTNRKAAILTLLRTTLAGLILASLFVAKLELCKERAKMRFLLGTLADARCDVAVSRDGWRRYHFNADIDRDSYERLMQILEETP